MRDKKMYIEMEGSVANIMKEFQREEALASNVHVELEIGYSTVTLTLREGLTKKYIFPISGNAIMQVWRDTAPKRG